MSNEPIVSVKKLTKQFGSVSALTGKGSVVRALNGVSFDVNPGETFGIVGESGCGKSTLGRCLLRLEEPTSGEIRFENRDLLSLNARCMRALRPRMQVVFQDPFASLNPRKSAGQIIGEGLRVHSDLTPAQIGDRVKELISKVGLRPEHADRYPHEFSGGQRQRIGIARAISMNPKFIVADEAVSALDVSVQAQILNLLVNLQNELGLTYLFISHDLGVVRHISDRVGVMYLGQIVEQATSRSLYRAPAHPYTEALLSAVPRTNPALKGRPELLHGDVPTSATVIKGCPFFSRCKYGRDRCQQEAPDLKPIGDGHHVACHFPLNQTAGHKAAFNA